MSKEVTFDSLPDTITYRDYAKWRRCGLNKALDKFHEKGFPLIKGLGVKLVADKRAVLLKELGLSEKDKAELLNKIAIEIVRKEVFHND